MLAMLCFAVAFCALDVLSFLYRRHLPITALMSMSIKRFCSTPPHHNPPHLHVHHHHFYASFIYPYLIKMLTWDKLLMAKFRLRWVAAKSRYEYAHLA